MTMNPQFVFDKAYDAAAKENPLLILMKRIK